MNLVRNKLYRLSIIVIILASLIPVSLISKSVEGAMVSSQMILSGGKTAARGMDEEKVRQMLENKIVAERLKSHGLSKDEVMAKMNRMSDEQIHQLAALSDCIPAGGDGAATAAVIVLVVFYNSHFDADNIEKDLNHYFEQRTISMFLLYNIETNFPDWELSL